MAKWWVVYCSVLRMSDGEKEDYPIQTAGTQFLP